jgi:phosphate transport system protein
MSSGGLEREMERRHTDREFESELQALRDRIFAMAGRVESMVAQGTTALLQRDPELARRTMELDAQVDADEIEIDRRCLDLLARRQPMASDLRFVTFTLKLVTDLERIGDLAQHLCQRVVDFGTHRNFSLPDEVPKMADLARAIITDAMDAFVRGDEGMARVAIARDSELDASYQVVQGHLVQMVQRGTLQFDDAVRVQKVVKYLERIGDHATNVAEKVIYMVCGEDVRHQGHRLPPR